MSNELVDPIDTLDELPTVTGLQVYRLGKVPTDLRLSPSTTTTELLDTYGICSNLILTNHELKQQKAEVSLILRSSNDPDESQIGVYIGANYNSIQDYFIHSYTGTNPETDLYYYLLIFDGPELPENHVRMIVDDNSDQPFPPTIPEIEGKRKAKSVTVSSLDGGGTFFV